jgi:hypothetical protein
MSLGMRMCLWKFSLSRFAHSLARSYTPTMRGKKEKNSTKARRQARRFFVVYTAVCREGKSFSKPLHELVWYSPLCPTHHRSFYLSQSYTLTTTTISLSLSFSTLHSSRVCQSLNIKFKDENNHKKIKDFNYQIKVCGERKIEVSVCVCVKLQSNKLRIIT